MHITTDDCKDGSLIERLCPCMNIMLKINLSLTVTKWRAEHNEPQQEPLSNLNIYLYVVVFSYTSTGHIFFFMLVWVLHAVHLLLCEHSVWKYAKKGWITVFISLSLGNRRHLMKTHAFLINGASVWCVNSYSRHVNRMLSATQHLSVRVLTCHQCSSSSSTQSSLSCTFPFCLDKKANWQV